MTRQLLEDIRSFYEAKGFKSKNISTKKYMTHFRTSSGSDVPFTPATLNLKQTYADDNDQEYGYSLLHKGEKIGWFGVNGDPDNPDQIDGCVVGEYEDHLEDLDDIQDYFDNWDHAIDFVITGVMLAIENDADNIFDIQFEDVNEGKILQSIKQAFKKIKSKAIKMKHKRSNKLKAAAKKSGVKKV